MKIRIKCPNCLDYNTIISNSIELFTFKCNECNNIFTVFMSYSRKYNGLPFYNHEKKEVCIKKIIEITF